jgi:phosphoglycerate dehydrogenase-like enzyme
VTDRVVAVSYAADDEFTKANLEVLGDEAEVIFLQPLPMAEHVMAMTLALARRLPERHAQLAAGEFNQREPLITLDDAVVAILGFGGIGTATARLMRAFGARIYAVNSSGVIGEPAEFAGTLAELDEVLAAADVLVVSLPLTNATRGLLGARELGLMKPSAILVNVARGHHRSAGTV